MGSAASPLFSGMVPGGTNPPGNLLSFLDLTKNKGANALLPNTNLSPSSVGSGNPYDIVPGGAAAPSFPANAGPYSSTGGSLIPPGGGSNIGQFQGTIPRGTNANAPAGIGMFGMQAMTPKDISRMFNDLKKTYGDGMAHLIMDFLQGGAGFNQQAVNNLLASLQPGIQRGEEDLMSQFSASGNRFGSGAQIGLGDFLSRVNLNEGELVTQMYEDSLNKFMDVMMGVADKNAGRRASSPSTLDSILGGIGLGGQAAGGLSSIISSIAPSADTGILDAIAGAAAFA